MSSLLEESHEIPTQPESSSKDIPPIDSFQLRQRICGVETELLIQTFDDRILVIITQNGKVGCLTQASLPPQIPLPPPPRPTQTNGHSNALHILEILPVPPPALQLTPLVGTPTNPTLYDLHTNQISTLVFYALEMSSCSRRNVVVGLSLKRTPNTHDSNPNEGNGDEEDILNDEERERFAGIMDLVSQWNGPQ
ncbi:uncharacterized protein I303_107154 [Kwoniella dejecticola CBS 10117]|uniref:Proteasome assembly chaperone 3 n=1 Tax=Kwoniella dejecticola CBS 10117 TaxID=1296121 RepID=A0A1A5ZYW8_9TREE|nr:uncharacterized protein I303_06555 [Kwoniella dejecticola CBS 10117]OBR82997.1 hypothetical protein I303_06555 [Kwoniella dejecticola CBS 10117]